MELELYVQWIGIFPKYRNFDPQENKFETATYFIIFGLFITSISTMAWSVLLLEKTSDIFSESVLMLLSASLMFAWYFTIFWYKKNYIAIFQEFNTIVEKSE